MIRQFINFNIYLSKTFEKLFFFNKNDKLLLFNVFQKEIKLKFKIADVGGGKKPAKLIKGLKLPKDLTYDGFDISLDELEISRDFYSKIFAINLNEPIVEKNFDYDLVICLNTLEHVKNTTQAIKNLNLLVKKGGKLYLKMPCKHAVFTKLNLIIPNQIKNLIMHRIYPHKKGDGFPAFYDKSTPLEIIKILESEGLTMEKISYVKWSSYFSFFFPFYIIWRVYTIFQNIFIKDYCESFEIIFYKK